MIINVNNNLKHNLKFLGTDYGGWGVDLNMLNDLSIVYSFGVGTDISFDEILIEKVGCKVYGFDPTPRSIEWVQKQSLNPNFIFFPVGLSNKDGKSFFNLPPRIDWVSFSETDLPNNESVECEVKKIKSILEMLGHNKIDLLKMDIEGSEYNVLDDMINENIFPDQLLIEFHKSEKNKIEDYLNKLSNYNIYKRIDRSDYYFIKKNV